MCSPTEHWLSFKNRGALEILVEGTGGCSTIRRHAVNPAKHPMSRWPKGQAFVDC